MNIIIPMAGMGKRMRPHTLTVPKPLLPVAGKPIVHRLVEDIAKVCHEKIDTIGFVVGHFGSEVEAELLRIAASVGAKGEIFYQEEALGTAHAVFCAAPLLKGRVIVAFADTLFKAEFKLNFNQGGIIWVQEVSDPSAFGVVKLNEKKEIVDFVEKPKEPVSNLAIIGIYYFRDGNLLHQEIKEIIDNNIRDSGEYQLTRALKNMQTKGTVFVPGQVEDWLDCGNKNATVETNSRYLQYLQEETLVAKSAVLNNSVIIPPCFVGEQVELHNTVVGPYVSIGEKSIIKDSRISSSIIQSNCVLVNVNLQNSMLGKFVTIEKKSLDFSMSDYSTLNQ
jgi:glucose-1-phosphate thymidylyltransferase